MGGLYDRSIVCLVDQCVYDKQAVHVALHLREETQIGRHWHPLFLVLETDDPTIQRIRMRGESLGTELSQGESLSLYLGHVQVIKVPLLRPHDFDSISDVAEVSGQSPSGAYSLSVREYQRVMSSQHQEDGHQAGQASAAGSLGAVALEECPLSSSSAVQS
jgi:hypothetical protein